MIYIYIYIYLVIALSPKIHEAGPALFLKFGVEVNIANMIQMFKFQVGYKLHRPTAKIHEVVL